MNEIRTDEFKELQTEIAAVRAEVKATCDALVAVMEPLRKSLEEYVAQQISRAAIDLEREFGSCVSFTAGSGARKQEADEMMRASLQSFERRLSRGAEHIARIESRLQRLEQ